MTLSGAGGFLLKPGSRIEVQQIGAGAVTFAGASGVTIRSSEGLTLNRQYASAVLTCDGSDLWTLSRGPNWIELTQAAYDALTPDPNTLYVVVG